jgi:hypothetical protein
MLKLFNSPPSLPEKMTVIMASSERETSRLYDDMKHSIFIYSLVKGFSGGADDGDKKLTMDEAASLCVNSVNRLGNMLQLLGGQSVTVLGSDLERVILEYP